MVTVFGDDGWVRQAVVNLLGWYECGTTTTTVVNTTPRWVPLFWRESVLPMLCYTDSTLETLP
ncbi:hypothetical protein E2C01_060646 [Portunus trituberculatus]|uniref:Uncharacterized protein n=1 Tax=Portunus trituberculatus TaxID=210409 RepID=A0A5B7HC05_PORTR|nr:hypothetical protein [Portunus trituberculatus]